jgi:hypothetical protein
LIRRPVDRLIRWRVDRLIRESISFAERARRSGQGFEDWLERGKSSLFSVGDSSREPRVNSHQH